MSALKHSMTSYMFFPLLHTHMHAYILAPIRSSDSSTLYTDVRTYFDSFRKGHCYSFITLLHKVTLNSCMHKHRSNFLKRMPFMTLSTQLLSWGYTSLVNCPLLPAHHINCAVIVASRK